MGMFDNVTCTYPLPMPEDLGELTQEQIGAVETYRDEHMDSSILNSGFSWVIWQWECAQEDE